MANWKRKIAKEWLIFLVVFCGVTILSYALPYTGNLISNIKVNDEAFAQPKGHLSFCEEGCTEMAIKGELRPGVTLEQCINILCKQEHLSPCEERCTEMAKKGELKLGVTLNECSKILCNATRSAESLRAQDDGQQLQRRETEQKLQERNTERRETAGQEALRQEAREAEQRRQQQEAWEAQQRQRQWEAREAARREYEAALADYNQAIEKLNNAKTKGHVGNVLSAANRRNPNPWAQLSALTLPVMNEAEIRDAEREVEIAWQRLEQAKARINYTQ